MQRSFHKYYLFLNFLTGEQGDARGELHPLILFPPFILLILSSFRIFRPHP